MDSLNSQSQETSHNCKALCGHRSHHWLAKIIIIVLIFSAGYCFGVFKTVVKYHFFSGYGHDRFFDMKVQPYDQGQMMYR